MKHLTQPLIASAILAASLTAGAHGQQWDVRGPSQPAITAEQAVAIAREQGITLIDELDLDSRKWEIDGYGDGRQELEIEISRDTGELLSRREGFQVRRPDQPNIGIERAIEIAREGGMTVITSIDLDGRKWEIEGYLEDGREVEIELSTDNGDVLQVDID